MQSGDRVKIYFDPITQVYFEGDAKLISRMDEIGQHEGGVLVNWRVKFVGETGIYIRTLLEPKNGSSISSSFSGTDLSKPH